MAIFIKNTSLRSFIYIRNKILSHNFCSNPKEKTWKVLKLNHLAVASADLNKSVKLFQDIFGIKTSQSIPMREHGVSTTFVELGNVKLELLLPFGEKSPIQNFLQKNADGGMHHICLDVDNIENAVKDLKANNIRTLTEETKMGAHGKPVIFLHPKDCGGILIELQQV